MRGSKPSFPSTWLPAQGDEPLAAWGALLGQALTDPEHAMLASAQQALPKLAAASATWLSELRRDYQDLLELCTKVVEDGYPLDIGPLMTRLDQRRSSIAAERLQLSEQLGAVLDLLRDRDPARAAFGQQALRRMDRFLTDTLDVAIDLHRRLADLAARLRSPDRAGRRFARGLVAYAAAAEASFGFAEIERAEIVADRGLLTYELTVRVAPAALRDRKRMVSADDRLTGLVELTEPDCAGLFALRFEPAGGEA